MLARATMVAFLAFLAVPALADDLAAARQAEVSAVAEPLAVAVAPTGAPQSAPAAEAELGKPQATFRVSETPELEGSRRTLRLVLRPFAVGLILAR